MVTAHISLSRGNTGSDSLFADANVIWFMRGRTKIDHRLTIKDGQRFQMKMCVWILNLVPDSESGKACGLLVCSLAVIWQAVIKSGLTFGLLYLEQLSLPYTMTDAAISDSDDRQLLTRLCITHPSLISIPSFQQRTAKHRGSSGSDRHSHSVGSTPLNFFRTGLFIQGSFLLHLNADCTTALENTCFRVVGGVAILSQFTRYTEAILEKDRKSTIACWRSVWTTTTTNHTNLKRWCLMTCEWDSTIKYLSAESPTAPLNCSEPWWQLPLRATLVNWTQVNLTPNKLWKTKGNSNKRTV